VPPALPHGLHTLLRTAHSARHVRARACARAYQHSARCVAPTAFGGCARAASSGIAIGLFALAWHRTHSYHSALLGGGLLALVLAALDLASLAKPEVLESVVRRAPTWEQLVAFRQRRGYFSMARRAKQRAARLASELHARASGGSTRQVDEEVRQHWIDATLEPVHQANPIERSLHSDAGT
jgi:hypothetical protein